MHQGGSWVGAMNFNNLYVDEVQEVPGATRFSVTGEETLQEIGGDSPVTFMATGSTTLQITDDSGTVLATGTLQIPSESGETNFMIDLNVLN